MARYNDLDIKNWKDYPDILTDSLWLIDKRDNTGLHTGFYHGNFVPQIPNQLFRRYTKKEDWILDPFMGSGTSLIEAMRLQRNAIGIEVQETVAKEVEERLASSLDFSDKKVYIKVGDSRNVDINAIMKELDIQKVQFVLFHPPYWDIIHFSKDPNEISNSPTLDDFLLNFGKIIDNTTQMLEKNRYCAVVIGDKYANSEVIPLGFLCMNLFLERGFKMKAILVKNFGETKGKQNQQGIWRYRALANDFYIFKHEYIFVFKKIK